MAMNKAAGKKKAPIRKANNFMKGTVGIALRLMLYVVVTVVVGLLLSVIQSIENDMLRLGVAGLLGFVVLAIYHIEGMNRGTLDAMSSRQMAKLEKAGHTITEKEDASCYHPLKAVVGSMLLYAVPLALAILLAVNAKEYTYVLQDLPTWLSGSYGMREDVMAPLAAYTQALGTGVMDWIRIVVRLFILVFINLFGDVQTAIGTIDRLSPLFMMLYPAAYVLGYLRGPAEQEKMEKLNKKAKKVAVRKHQKKKLVDELLGSQNVPHYGHQADKAAHKKKELI
jgi:hypothetical protein